MNRKVSKTIGDIRFPNIVKIATRWGFPLTAQIDDFARLLLSRGGATPTPMQINTLNIYLRVEGARSRILVKPLWYALAAEGMTVLGIEEFLADHRKALYDKEG